MTDAQATEAPELTGEQVQAEEISVEANAQPEVQEADQTAAAEQTDDKPEPEEAQPETETAPAADPSNEEENAAKRKLTEDSSEAPDNKRMNTGEMNGMEGAQEPVELNNGQLPPDTTNQQGETVGYVSIAEGLVAKLIGKDGAVIHHLEHITGSKIQVEHNKPGNPGEDKHVRIIAKSQAELDSVRQQIKETLESEHPPGQIRKTMSCPHGMVGRIIGRAGETIRSLQQASQAKIIVDQDPTRFPEGAPREIHIEGRAPCVDRAEKMVLELMNAEPGVSAQSVIQKYGLGNSRTIDCPKPMVGRVIGKGGDTIKQLQRSTGTNIQIDQTTTPCKITITGQNPNVQQAMRQITSIINEDGFAGGYGGGGAGGMPGGSGFPGQGYGGGFPGQGGFAAPYGAYGSYQQPQQGFNPYQGYGGYQQPQQNYAGYGGDQGGYGAAGGYGGYGGQQAGVQGMGMGGPAPAAAAPASDWSEEYDSSSGRAYYYNRTTGQTQWERPAEM